MTIKNTYPLLFSLLFISCEPSYKPSFQPSIFFRNSKEQIKIDKMRKEGFQRMIAGCYKQDNGIVMLNCDARFVDEKHEKILGKIIEFQIGQEIQTPDHHGGIIWKLLELNDSVATIGHFCVNSMSNRTITKGNFKIPIEEKERLRMPASFRGELVNQKLAKKLVEKDEIIFLFDKASHRIIPNEETWKCIDTHTLPHGYKIRQVEGCPYFDEIFMQIEEYNDEVLKHFNSMSKNDSINIDEIAMEFYRLKRVCR